MNHVSLRAPLRRNRITQISGNEPRLGWPAATSRTEPCSSPPHRSPQDLLRANALGVTLSCPGNRRTASRYGGDHPDNRTCGRHIDSSVIVIALRPCDLIGHRVGARGGLRRAVLDFPVYLTVPHSGDSIVTIACPLDPSDEDWSDASTIVCRIIGKRLGDVRMRSRALVCAIAKETIAAADLTAGSTQSAG
jgi:hypothetical protein